MNKKTMLIAVMALSSVALAQNSVPGTSNSMPGMNMNTDKNTDKAASMKGTASASPTMNSGMGGMDMASMNMALNSLSKLSGKEFDRAFLSMMIPHHMAAVAMSKAILPLSKDPQVKVWANNIIRSQQNEIRTMNVLLKPLGGPNADLTTLMQKSMSGMTKMITASQTPDVAFVQGMLPHHSSAIDMANLALEKSSDPQVLKLAKDIVVAQAGEMYGFKIWLNRQSQ